MVKLDFIDVGVVEDVRTLARCIVEMDTCRAERQTVSVLDLHDVLISVRLRNHNLGISCETRQQTAGQRADQNGISHKSNLFKNVTFGIDATKLQIVIADDNNKS